MTRTERESDVGAHIQGGSYGTYGANAHVALKTGRFNNRLSGNFAASDGGSGNDDFEKGGAFWNGRYDSERLSAPLQAGMSVMHYGANTFYGTGSDSQYEQDRRYLLSVAAEYKGRIRVPVQVYWNRSLDHYVWWRANPSAYQNFHQTNVYGANVNAYTTWALGKSAIGLEYRRENILSTRLGKEIDDPTKYKVPGRDEYYKYKDGRDNVGIYLEHDATLGPVVMSVGVLANYNSAADGGMKLCPGIDLAWHANARLRLFVSFNKSIRMPTYTDLYYNGPGLQGNAQLKPEQSTDWHVGAAYAGAYYRLQVKAFYRKGTDMIDWVKYEGQEVYTTANSDIDNIGAELSSTFDLTRPFGKNSFVRTISLSYCYNYKHRVDEEQSANYVSRLTFMLYKIVSSVNLSILPKLTAQWDFTLKNREGEFDNATTGLTQKYGTYGNLDVKLQWQEPKYTLYVQASNLTNHKYYDHANVEQPGIWIMAGAKLRLKL